MVYNSCRHHSHNPHYNSKLHSQISYLTLNIHHIYKAENLDLLISFCVSKHVYLDNYVSNYSIHVGIALVFLELVYMLYKNHNHKAHYNSKLLSQISYLSLSIHHIYKEDNLVLLIPFCVSKHVYLGNYVSTIHVGMALVFLELGVFIPFLEIIFILLN